MQAQLPVPGEVRESRVDWLTATATEASARSWFSAHAPALIGREQSAGNEVRAWRWLEYAGASCGQAAYGERADSAVVRLSGTQAGVHWREWAEHADNVSRIDLAVTVHVGDAPGELATNAYRDAQASARRRGAELSASLILNSDGGRTVYVGSRSSDRFARLYDKHRESKRPEYAGCWRYEVELKRRAALASARWLARQLSETDAILRAVWTHYHDRGVTPLYRVSRRLLLPAPVAHKTDDQRRLEWLYDQVRHTVADLLARYDRATVEQALGLALPGGQP